MIAAVFVLINAGVIVFFLVSDGFHRVEKTRMRNRIDSLEARLGMGDERARREIVAAMRSEAIQAAKEGQPNTAERLLAQALGVEKGGGA